MDSLSGRPAKACSGKLEDTAGKTWLAYNDPAWLAQRHGLGPEADATVGAMTAALAALARAATSP